MTTAMARETMEASDAVGRGLEANAAALADLARRLAAKPPAVVVTSARGSSDHAASYLKYLVEILIGIPCSSMGASVVSIYEAPLKVQDALVLTVSQSGRSPDIVAFQDAARRRGGLTVAIVNDGQSPLAQGADICLPLLAGRETSVAATKSFIASLAVAAALVAAWSDDKTLGRAVASLPDTLDRAQAYRWAAAEPVLTKARSLYMLGRGPAFPIAQEAALKLKETSGLHAEAYSSAEVMHGPLELVGEAFPVVVFSPDDAARQTTTDTMARLRKTGAHVMAVEPGEASDERLAYPPTGHPFVDPIAMVQVFYRLADTVARARGHDPDRPRWLSKVTETT
ncbi:MAG TPA: SIS domain-containing protein [Aestuariivirgaceae bacterium]|nr:SIS domain-containing protein [Aestuariivirgaceae bacterium]